MDQALIVMERVETVDEVKKANNKLILETTEKTGSGERIRTYEFTIMSQCSYVALYF